jgi:hypothetical protein
MSPLTRRTALVAVSLALATGCARTSGTGTAPATPAARPSPTATEAPEPTKPAGGETVHAPEPAVVAAASKLLVTGKDYGKGWTETVDEAELEFPRDGEQFCDNSPLAADSGAIFGVTWRAVEKPEAEVEFTHAVAVYRPGFAKSAVDELNAVYAACRPARDDWDGVPIEISAKSTGPNTADVTWRDGEVAVHYALRFQVRGDYVSTVVAHGQTRAASRTIADEVSAIADRKFAVAGIG